MALSKEAKALVQATEQSSEVASNELSRILKESKDVNKKLVKEYKRVSNKPLLKQRVAQLYCSGYYNNQQIASILMVSKQTVVKLLKDPDVLDMILTYQDEEKKLIDTRIKSLRFKATDTLDELLDSDDDAIRLQVAKDILDRTGHKEKEQKEVNVNISYEQQLKQLVEGVDFEIVEVD